jgi:GTPase SAR1 family protein
MQEKMAYLETSAALNVNIDRIFEMLSGKIDQIEKQKTGNDNNKRVFSIVVDPAGKKGNKKCCE